MSNKAIDFLSGVAVIIIVAIGVYTRFSHIGKTEAELIVEFWHRWLFCALLALHIAWLNYTFRQ